MTQLYRHFDSRGRLLYVGISNSGVTRLAAHKRSKWFHRIKRITFTKYPSRKRALAAEAYAVKTEKPLFNKMHTVSPSEQNYHVRTILVRLLECLRCGHEWQSKVPNPRVCPHCKNPNWNIPKATNPRLRRNGE